MTDPYTDANVEAALRRFRTHVLTQEEQDREKRRRERETEEEKSAQLLPLRMLLAHLVKMGVMVYNTAQTSHKNLDAPPQLLLVNERASSETWAPGISMVLDHPAQIEIAVPNPRDVADKGVVVIHLSSTHPDAAMFERRFATMSEAVDVLADFLARNTVSVARMDLGVREEATSPPATGLTHRA